MNELTKSQKVLWEYYLSIRETQFCRSLDRIATETRLSYITVRRGNDRLRDLGWIIWLQGHGNRVNNAAGRPNVYRLLTLEGSPMTQCPNTPIGNS